MKRLKVKIRIERKGRKETTTGKRKKPNKRKQRITKDGENVVFKILKYI